MYVEFRNVASGAIVCEPSLSVVATIDLGTSFYDAAIHQIDECSQQDKIGKLVFRVFTSEHTNERITIAFHREVGASVTMDFDAQGNPSGSYDVNYPTSSSAPILVEFDVPAVSGQSFDWTGEAKVDDSKGSRTLPLTVKVKKVPGGPGHA